MSGSKGRRYLSRFKNMNPSLLELEVFTTPTFRIVRKQMEKVLEIKDVTFPTDTHLQGYALHAGANVSGTNPPQARASE
ncbi:hypothetical protein BGZ68_006667 [Mortierella alpina]|nr:hypothetical protein BGZ68_006667 [Mortierella alpina]